MKKLKRKQSQGDKKDGENDSASSNGVAPEKKAKSEEVHIRSKEEREKFKHSLYRPPTHDELNVLRETEDLFKNNLFRMQVSYLLEEVKISDKKNSQIEEFLHSLHKFLNNIKPTEKYDISDQSWIPKDVNCPIPELPSSHKKGKIQFGKPSSIKVIGSYLLKTSTKPNYTVDVAVGMPEGLLQAKDHLNFRYHAKRALYLTFLASHLRKWSEIESLTFSRIYNQPFKPILVLKPAGKAGKKYTIKIYPMIPDNVFKLSRFDPLKNNVRLSWYDQKNADDANGDFAFPTPKYNASVLSDMLFENHLTILYEAITECEGLKDAIPLLKVWLRQRGLSEGDSSFNGFQMSMLLSYLLSKKKISPHMSAFQIFRVTLQYLATCDWTTKGISMARNDKSSPLPTLDDFHSVYDVVFVDSSGHLNLCSNMRKSTFRQLKYNAQLAIDSLQDGKDNNFDALFMKPSKFYEVYDHWFSITDPSTLAGISKSEDLKLKLIDAGGDGLPVALESIIPTLEKGLGNRIEYLEIKQQTTLTWPIDATPPQSSISDATIGLLINNDHVDNILDMGPPADTPEAKDFRNFWGEKSDLRRFKDGSINEAVLWEGKNKAEKRLICKQVVEYLLQRFFKISPFGINYVADQLDSIVQPNYNTDKDATHKRQQESKHYATATGEEDSLKVIYALDELSKKIKNLEDLPLEVNSIQGSEPASRLTEVFPPRFAPNKEKNTSKSSIVQPSKESREFWSPSIDVVLQFEGSGKWPDDFQATQYVKAAFYIKLASLLNTQCSLPAHASTHHVDVLHSGYVFRIRIYHQREIQLCKQIKASTEGGTVKKEIEKMARSLDVDMVKKPLHTTMIHSVNQRFGAYALTARLAKRWVSAQMLGDFVTDEAIELIVAFLFLKPMPHRPPGCHINGFLRFLTLIATHDWHNDPLIIDLNGTLKADDYIEIRERFTTQRHQLPAMFLCTPYDKNSSIWTKESITLQTLSRLTTLAKLSRDVLEGELKVCKPENLKQIFRPPLDDYNVLIKLDSQMLPRHYQAIDSTIKLKIPKQNSDSRTSLPVVNFDPARIYLNELKSSFSDIAWFFYDKYGSTVIGVVWKPSAFTPQAFKILSLKYRMPSMGQPNEKSKVASTSQQHFLIPNTEAIIEDFRTIGQGLVTDVITKKSL